MSVAGRAAGWRGPGAAVAGFATTRSGSEAFAATRTGGGRWTMTGRGDCSILAFSTVGRAGLGAAWFGAGSGASFAASCGAAWTSFGAASAGPGRNWITVSSCGRTGVTAATDRCRTPPGKGAWLACGTSPVRSGPGMTVGQTAIAATTNPAPTTPTRAAFLSNVRSGTTGAAARSRSRRRSQS